MRRLEADSADSHGQRQVQAARLAAAILAGGLGKRMGGIPKCTLEIAGLTVLERIVIALRHANISTINVVVGPYRQQLLPLIKHCGARAIEHVRVDASLIDSQRLALDAHEAHNVDYDLLLVLADLPLLTSADISPLLHAWQQRATTVHAMIPVVNGVRGHPLLLSGYAVGQVAAEDSSMGIRDWLRARPEIVQPFHTSRRAYVTDLDTPDDLVALKQLLEPGNVTL